jgi:hypothetical protein
MDVEVTSRRAFRSQLLWIVLGIILEFLFIPREGHGARNVFHENNLFSSADFYYALVSPIIVWWFFRRLIPAKEKALDVNGVRFLNLIFGFYAASALRAILAAFFAIHTSVWGVNSN